MISIQETKSSSTSVSLQSIVLDCDSQFVNDFWKFLCKRLDINTGLSIAWHLETNGQTKRLNGVME